MSTSAADVIEILELLEPLGADPRLSGGWGVDALLGRQTREHRDVDLGIRTEAVDASLAVLRQAGFEVTTDWLPVRVELSRGRCHVDLHPLHHRVDGSAWQSGLDDTIFEYPAHDWVDGRIAGRAVVCLSAGRQRAFHEGYAHTDEDRHDLAALDQHEPARADEPSAGSGRAGSGPPR